MICKLAVRHPPIFLLIFLTSGRLLLAQKTIEKKKPEELPFAIAAEKKMSDEDLANKKEGFYLTGLPQLSSDPLNGFGYGVEGSLFFNGSKKDPFYRYTPYRHRFDVLVFNTTQSQREIAFKYDAPYIFGSKWRLRAAAAYENNPNLVYFGQNETSLKNLNYTPKGSSKPVMIDNYNDYSDYLNNSGQSQYNFYRKEEALLNVSFEHSFLQSKLRLLAGYEVARVNISTFSGNSFLRNDANSANVLGVDGSLLTIWQLGIVYDTRNLETDPSKGIFAELTNEYSAQGLGSAFSFNKTFGQVKTYYPLLPSVFKKFIFATRFGMGYTAGNAPFYEYQDQWSSEGSIEGLGGANTLRGYKQSRFLGRLMDFANFELRYRFAQLAFLQQHWAFSIVPFFDVGGVWDSFSRFFHTENYRYSAGLGLRIAWNVSTIIRLDYAYSKEDQQFFFNFGHTF